MEQKLNPNLQKTKLRLEELRSQLRYINDQLTPEVMERTRNELNAKFGINIDKEGIESDIRWGAMRDIKLIEDEIKQIKKRIDRSNITNIRLIEDEIKRIKKKSNISSGIEFIDNKQCKDECESGPDDYEIDRICQLEFVPLQISGLIPNIPKE